MAETLPPSVRSWAPGVRTVDAPQRFMGMSLGARATLLTLDGGLLIHSPVSMSDEAAAALGPVRWALAPNLFHHLYAGAWQARGATLYGALGLDQKRPDLRFDGILDGDAHPFGEDIAIRRVTGLPLTNELVLLHRPSRTLIVTDLVFHLSAEAPAFTRAAMRMLGGYPGCRSTLLERVAMKREAARDDLRTLLSWEWDRLIMAHGEVIETGGRDALREAFAWLDL